MKMRLYALWLCLLQTLPLLSQTPKLYVNLATHNEMINEYYDTDSDAYQSTRDSLYRILQKMESIQGKWNFQTCSKFVLGALQWENAATNPNDILETMQQSGSVEIDPRNKQQLPIYNYNISDVYHLLDSCGVTSTHTVGGFLHYPFSGEDWTPFRDPVYGNVYGEPWQAEIIWGGGSPNHVNDCNNYGCWKPYDGGSDTDFYTHAPDSNLWLVGNGCAPVISDTTTNVQWIISLLRQNVRAIQHGWWPQDKFYCLSVMINCRDLDVPGYMTKVMTLLDSMDVMVNEGIMEWSFISEKLTTFQSWSNQHAIPYSQWSCTEATNPSLETNLLTEADAVVFPNPTDDFIHFQGTLPEQLIYCYTLTGQYVTSFNTGVSGTTIQVSAIPDGMYFFQCGTNVFRVVIDHH
jgi:hypothetical protein